MKLTEEQEEMMDKLINNRNSYSKMPDENGGYYLVPKIGEIAEKVGCNPQTVLCRFDENYRKKTYASAKVSQSKPGFYERKEENRMIREENEEEIVRFPRGTPENLCLENIKLDSLYLGFKDISYFDKTMNVLRKRRRTIFETLEAWGIDIE